jgi:hypothetical protein
MEESKPVSQGRPQQIPEDKDQTLQIATIQPEQQALAVNASHATRERINKHAQDIPLASQELATILNEIENCFGKQASYHDLEGMNFSLRQLFNRVDFLYRYALPDLETWTEGRQGDYSQEILKRQRLWLQLQTINRTLDRMAPLCHLLSDTIECLLDTLDDEELWLRTVDEEDTIQLEQIKMLTLEEQKRQLSQRRADPTNETAHRLSPARWEQAVNALMDQLLLWQEQHNKLASFTNHFSLPVSCNCNLNELDNAFAMLLDSAGAIFGDILPHFRLIEPHDREQIGALLFDLMQQSDQMLVQFEITLEPFTKLIRHFAVVGENT